VVVDGEGHVELKQVHQLPVQRRRGVAVQGRELCLDQDGAVLQQGAHEPAGAAPVRVRRRGI